MQFLNCNTSSGSGLGNNEKTPFETVGTKDMGKSKTTEILEKTDIHIKTPLEIGEIKEELNHNDTPIMTDVWQVYGRNMEGIKHEKIPLENLMVESKKHNKPPTEIKGAKEKAGSMEQKALIPQIGDGIKSTWAVKKSVPFLVPGLA